MVVKFQNVRADRDDRHTTPRVDQGVGQAILRRYAPAGGRMHGVVTGLQVLWVQLGEQPLPSPGAELLHTGEGVFSTDLDAASTDACP